MACAALAVAGCAGQDDSQGTSTTTAALEPGQETPLGGDGGTTATSPVFVTLQSQFSCGQSCEGGFWVHELGSEADARWVGELDISQLPQTAMQQASGAAPGQLLLQGFFTTSVLPDVPPTFHATDAWRGLPSVAAPAGDPFVRVFSVDGVLVARVLDSRERRVIGAVSLGSLDAKYIDSAWLSSRVVTGGAVVAGQFDGWTLNVAQVFMHLPDLVGVCPQFGYDCGPDAVATFTLSSDRCLVPTGCAARRDTCPEFIPSCEPGYTLLSWPVQPHACTAFACMPSWLDQ